MGVASTPLHGLGLNLSEGFFNESVHATTAHILASLKENITEKIRRTATLKRVMESLVLRGLSSLANGGYLTESGKRVSKKLTLIR